MSRPHDALHHRLTTWAHAYGGDQYQRLGYASTERITLHPDAPQACDEARHIETLLRCMEQGGRWREARVLRCEYLLRAKPECERLAALSRIGLRVSRASYYIYLRHALAYLDGAFSAGHPS